MLCNIIFYLVYAILIWDIVLYYNQPYIKEKESHGGSTNKGLEFI